jgi:drug/metabolite transporter (DMT)-like permease
MLGPSAETALHPRNYDAAFIEIPDHEKQHRIAQSARRARRCNSLTVPKALAQLMTIPRGPLFGLLAAALFGLSPPLAKLLIGQTNPHMLAGLLYTGSGAGLAVVMLARRLSGPKAKERPRITGGEWGWLAGAIFFGGMLAPVLLMTGLARTEAASTSLLLNLEGVFTALIAWFAFREGVNRRVAGGFALILLGGVAISWTRGSGFSLSPAALLIVGACLSWGIDNNFTRKVSHADAFTTAALKGLVAGIVNVVLARSTGAGFPAAGSLIAALLLGFVSYGLSLVFFIVGLRHVGAARTGAYFSTAPFIGAMVAGVFLHEHLAFNVWIAGALMAAGVWLHLTESREETEQAMKSAR